MGTRCSVILMMIFAVFTLGCSSAEFERSSDSVDKTDLDGQGSGAQQPCPSVDPDGGCVPARDIKQRYDLKMGDIVHMHQRVGVIYQEITKTLDETAQDLKCRFLIRQEVGPMISQRLEADLELVQCQALITARALREKFGACTPAEQVSVELRVQSIYDVIRTRVTEDCLCVLEIRQELPAIEQVVWLTARPEKCAAISDRYRPEVLDSL